MEENSPDPLGINKDPEIIKAAQAEIGNIDVLVCGSCHDVFHFVEEFQEHKAGECEHTSAIKENYLHEPKPQVWAFMLWKNSQFRNAPADEPAPTSWIVYQKWCKLSAEDKEAWLVAAKGIQKFAKLSSAKIQELRNKSQSQSAEKKSAGIEHVVTVDSLLSDRDACESNPVEDGEIQAQREALKAQADMNKVSDDADPLGGVDTPDEEEGDEEPRGKRRKSESSDVSKANDLIKKGIVKPVQLNSDVTILPSTKKNVVCKKALRTNTEDKKEEFVVETILSKRFNPRKKTYEYLIKWENFDKNENTWEPAANLSTCKELLQEFESNLQKQKLQKMGKANLLKQIAERKESKEEASPVLYNQRGRPQRTSKQKALNQVKVWCGDISDADEENSLKRRHDDDDSDSDSVEKRIKREAEENSDSSDDELVKNAVVVKKIVRQKSVNGVDKAPIPHNILIPDAQGVIRINQKQASELSSGVYIMSKTAGIIKLDKNTTRMATSGGQTIVKVAPKVGQTHIKVVKKEVPQNVIKLTPKNTKVAIPRLPSKTFIKSTPKQMLKKKMVETPKTEKTEPMPDDESDGLSELEFPTDLPLPPPDSPPGEFTLDPNTGKLVGVEYPPDKEVVISEEKPRDFNLETLVQQATGDDGAEPKESEESAEKHPEEKKDQVPAAVPAKTNVNGSSILQRKLLSTPARQPGRVTKTHIINPAVRNAAPNKSIVRTRIVSPKQKSTLPSNTPTITRVRHSYASTKGVPRKIGQTTIYRTSAKPPAKPDQPSEDPPTISMPSLSADGDQPADNVEQISTLAVPETLADLSSLVELQDQTESPLMLTGEDGTVYQVAGQNEQGQTILISQGADGEQQCLVVATESLQVDEGGVAQTQVVQMSESDAELQETLEGEPESDSSAEETQVVAQLIGADPPSPGGKRNVTVMLPDGSCVTMSVTQEQYEALEIDK